MIRGAPTKGARGPRLAITVFGLLVLLEAASVMFAVNRAPVAASARGLRGNRFAQLFVPEGESVVIARRAPTIVVDGDLSEWPDAHFVDLTHWRTSTRDGGPAPNGLSARAAVMWNDDTLYLAVEVIDPLHTNDQAGSEIWRGDSIQMGFDSGSNGGETYDSDDVELGWARTSAGDRSYQWVGPAPGGFGGTAFVSARQDHATRYELRLEAATLRRQRLLAGDSLGFSIVVHDSNGGPWRGALEWTPGMLFGKHPASFGIMRLLDV